MRAWWIELALASSFMACADAHDPCPIERPSCAPRGANEWASSPAGGSTLIPERVELRTEEPVVETTFLAVPIIGDAQRITYWLGLTEGRVAIVGSEPVDGSWARARLDALRASGELDHMLACVVLPGRGELRALPSHVTSDPPPPGEFFGEPIGGALFWNEVDRVRLFDVWVPPWGTAAIPNVARSCSRALVITQSTGARAFRWNYTPGGACPNSFDCLPGTWTWSDPSDGLELCEL